MSALIATFPPIEWKRGQSDLMGKYPADSPAPEQKLVVAKAQCAVVVARESGTLELAQIEFSIGELQPLAISVNIPLCVSAVVANWFFLKDFF
jgi:hypothetical protein